MWRGSITDLSTGEETIVRDLIVKADSLSAPVVWSEVFADCDAPSTSVEWSDFSAVTARGEYVEPSAVFVSYQTVASGGCSNTDAALSPDHDRSVVQTTGTARLTPDGKRVSL